MEILGLGTLPRKNHSSIPSYSRVKEVDGGGLGMSQQKVSRVEKKEDAKVRCLDKVFLLRKKRKLL